MSSTDPSSSEANDCFGGAEESWESAAEPLAAEFSFDFPPDASFESWSDSSLPEASFDVDSSFGASFSFVGDTDLAEWPPAKQDSPGDGAFSGATWLPGDLAADTDFSQPRASPSSSASGDASAASEFDGLFESSGDFPAFSIDSLSDSFCNIALDGTNPFESEAVSFFEGEGIESPKPPSHVPK
ncbi:MAG: hypothetical protein Q8P67_10985 [archaeon]|nr:hypothetical protein [archaeon]